MKERRKVILSSRDKAHISEHRKDGALKLSEDLFTTLVAVQVYMAELKLEANASVDIVAKHKLRKTRTWLQLQDEFNVSELEYFEEKYAQYISQFKEDVLVTEETQIFLVIKLEIMLHRNAKAKHGSSKEISRIVGIRDEFISTFKLSAPMKDHDRTYVLELDTQIQAQKTAEAARSGEFLKLEEKHQALLKDLKATREQRISRVESSRESFLAIIKKLQDQEERDSSGIHMELMKMVGEKEMDRLSEPHTYLDKVIDLPILNADTVSNLGMV